LADDGTTRFQGYPRANGTVGVRNHVLVLALLGLVERPAARVAQAVPGVVSVLAPYGRGQYGADKALYTRLLQGLGSNPNVAAVLIVGADRKSADPIAAAIAKTAKPVAVVALDDTHEDALELTSRGIREAGRLVHAVSRVARVARPVADLFVGVECGHSDATSGMVANPVAGGCVDWLVDQGARAVIGETIEWLGAERALAARAISPAVAHALTEAVLRRERDLTAANVDLTGNNPGAENIRGGLSTIEEKSLGAIAKTGDRPIAGLLAMGEPPDRPGLFLMDGPSFSPESLTGFAAAGAQLMMFTTGAGNSFCNALAPTIKITGRPDTAARLGDQIDFDASPVFAGRESLEAASRRLSRLVVEIASGALTWGEAHGEGAETFVRIGASM
jgi:altronate dehydratase large subunit